MKLYFAFTAAMSVNFIFLGFIALKGEGRKYARKLFFLMCFTMSIFLFCAGYSISGDDRGTVVFWYRLSSLGFAPFYAFNLHFYLNLAYGNGLRKKDLIIYIPVPFILVSTFISSSLFKDFVLLNGIWRFSPAYGSPWFWVYLLYYFPYTASTVYLIHKWASHSGRRIQQRQALFISVFTLITLFIGSFFDFLFPYIFNIHFPPLGPLTVAFYIYGLWFVLLKYNFLEIMPFLVVNEILNNINEMVFIIDTSLNISSSNLYAVKTLGIDPDFEKNPLYFPDLIQEPIKIISIFSDIKESITGNKKCRLVFINKDHPIYSDSYIKVLTDSFKEVSGFLVLSKINECISDFIKTYKITKREMEIIELCADGKSSRQIAEMLFISERTVETHITNIFHKTGTTGRIELFALASRYRIDSST